MRCIYGSISCLLLCLLVLLATDTARGIPAPPRLPGLKGKVVYEGDPPVLPDFKDQINRQKDKDHCLKGDVSNPTWKVHKADKAVANVVIWLRRPDGRPFDVPARERTRQDIVTLDQPYCAFEPHVFVLFPFYRDPDTGQRRATGQKFRVVNSAPIVHNVRMEGSAITNPARIIILRSKEERVVSFMPDRHPIRFNCDIHKLMSAYVWAFDHPYAAVSKEDGAFQIKSPATDVEVEVYAWHEANPTFIVDGKEIAGRAAGVVVQRIMLKKSGNTLDIKVKAK